MLISFVKLSPYYIHVSYFSTMYFIICTYGSIELAVFESSTVRNVTLHILKWKCPTIEKNENECKTFQWKRRGLRNKKVLLMHPTRSVGEEGRDLRAECICRMQFATVDHGGIVWLNRRGKCACEGDFPGPFSADTWISGPTHDRENLFSIVTHRNTVTGTRSNNNVLIFTPS
jgi:hypothetical protein